ncbi:MAG: hypothetical protein LBD66_02605 [Holosporales bacterium]|nr:hypothetical protein [Holosporales bacterium]
MMRQKRFLGGPSLVTLICAISGNVFADDAPSSGSADVSGQQQQIGTGSGGGNAPTSSSIQAQNAARNLLRAPGISQQQQSGRLRQITQAETARAGEASIQSIPHAAPLAPLPPPSVMVPAGREETSVPPESAPVPEHEGGEEVQAGLGPTPLVTPEALQEALGRLRPVPDPSEQPTPPPPLPIEAQEEQRAAEVPELELAAASEVAHPEPPIEAQAESGIRVERESETAPLLPTEHIETAHGVTPDALTSARAGLRKVETRETNLPLTERAGMTSAHGVTPDALTSARAGLRKVETRETNLPLTERAEHTPVAPAAEAHASSRALAAQAMQPRKTGHVAEAPVNGPKPLLPANPVRRAAAEAPVGPVPRRERSTAPRLTTAPAAEAHAAAPHAPVHHTAQHHEK